MRTVRSILAVALVAAGCIHVPTAGASWSDPLIVVTRSSALQPAPREAGCALQLFRTRPPEAPYEEFAVLHALNANGLEPDRAQQAIEARACALGADALVITQERYVRLEGGGAQVTAVAIKYRATPPVAPPRS